MSIGTLISAGRMAFMVTRPRWVQALNCTPATIRSKKRMRFMLRSSLKMPRTQSTMRLAMLIAEFDLFSTP